MLPWRCFGILAVLLSLSVSLAAQAQTAVPNSKEQVRLSFAPVAHKASPAVVNIYARRVVRTQASPILADPFFRRFFGEVMPPGMSRERVQNSLGSGVIVGADGTVVTNHHVVAGADEVTVVLSDRREFEAKLMGSDERTDLAVLKIDPKGGALPTLAFGDSDALEVGDLVLAIGNPFGVGLTVTSGIVSALARTNVGVSDYRSFIQTDAAINPGNSGGALVDMDGRLIGINTAIYSKEGGGSVGIGFAIPSSLVKVVLTGIAQGGKVVRPWLGASGEAVNYDIAKSINLARPAGVLINQLAKEGPAARAGIQLGDIVVAINGRSVDDPEALKFRLATLAVGGDAKLTLWRDGAQRIISVPLNPPPDDPPREPSDIAGANPLSGAQIANLNPALAEEIGMGGSGGVVVLRVRPGSVAQRLQIQPHDIILSINDRRVASVADAKRLLESDNRSWRVALSRSGQTITLMIGG